MKSSGALKTSWCCKPVGHGSRSTKTGWPWFGLGSGHATQRLIELLVNAGLRVVGTKPLYHVYCYTLWNAIASIGYVNGLWQYKTQL